MPPRVPGALVLVVSGLPASWLFNLGDHGVALVGADGSRPAADAGHQINGRSSIGCSQSFSENSDVPGAEFEVARRCFTVGEEIGHVLREDEVYGSPAPVVDDMDPLASPIGCRVDL